MSELLDITQEECAEIIQAISKIKRFGLDSTHPLNDDVSNKKHLEEELGDLMCCIDLLVEQYGINKNEIDIARRIKINKLRKWSNINLTNYEHEKF